MKAILVKDEMCVLWEAEICAHDDCPFTQLEPLPNSVAHPKCDLPDWPSVSREQLREIMMFHGDETLGQAVDRAVDLLRSIGVIIREPEKEGPR